MNKQLPILNETDRFLLRHLAKIAPNGKTGKQLATLADVSENHVNKKVVPRLKAYGVINERNGTGYRLIRGPELAKIRSVLRQLPNP